MSGRSALGWKDLKRKLGVIFPYQNGYFETHFFTTNTHIQLLISPIGIRLPHRCNRILILLQFSKLSLSTFSEHKVGIRGFPGPGR